MLKIRICSVSIIYINSDEMVHLFLFPLGKDPFYLINILEIYAFQLSISQFANYQLPVESNYSTSIPSPNPIYPRSVNDLSISLRSTTLPSIFLGCLLILFFKNLSLLQQPMGIYIYGEVESSPNSSSLSGI